MLFLLVLWQIPLLCAGSVSDYELPVKLSAERGKRGLQSNTVALAVETGTEGFDCSLG